MAARAFKPGHFYRLQNYETLAPRVDGTTLAMEGKLKQAVDRPVPEASRLAGRYGS